MRPHVPEPHHPFKIGVGRHHLSGLEDAEGEPHRWDQGTWSATSSLGSLTQSMHSRTMPKWPLNSNTHSEGRKEAAERGDGDNINPWRHLQ